MKTKEEYEPYGDEWAKEMMRLPKAKIVEMYAKACKLRDTYKELAGAQELLAKHLKQHVNY